jgi:hypothetical protein
MGGIQGSLLKQRSDEHPFAHKVMVVDKTVVVVVDDGGRDGGAGHQSSLALSPPNVFAIH